LPVTKKLNLRRLAALLLLAVLPCATALFVVQAQNPQTTINIDASAGRHAISKYIYGLAYGGTALSDLNCPIQRYGGNNTTRYNWQINADNRGSDWFFESIGDTSSTPAQRIDSFVSQSQSASAESMVTIPMIGWVAKLGTGRAKLASFSIAKYGAQTGSDQWFPDAGNGILTSGQDVTGNDPNDANVPADSSFHQGLVQHEVSVFGTAAAGGLKYYLLDNESSIWQATHRDVHPVGATMDEIKSKILDYAGMIKSVDPSALVVGPEEWGWSGYFFSGYDQQWGSQHGWSNLPDRANHGGQDYLPWLLDQLHQNETTTGKRLLDVFSVHYYPQGGEFGNDTSTAMQLLRNQSTRSLWDPSYIDQSWINDKVQLIPRLKGWISAHYPGTQIAITEYNWGAEGHINGATTQADIFGIFGREGLDFGSRWTTPDPSTPTYNAIKMYRNYDGQKSTFGDTSVQDTVANPDSLSSFAAVRTSDGALTIMVVNKVLTGQTPATINLANFANQGLAQVWQLTSSNTITRLGDIHFSGNSFTETVPPQSITLFVVPAVSTDEAPTAVLKATPSSGTAPLMVAFDGTGSSDPDGSITSYSWDFGDGNSGSGATVNHQYANAGSYTATLRVTDSSGLSASATGAISVAPGPNYVGFIDHAACDTIGGWAADRNRLNTSINVEIYDGTTLISTVMASNSRPDVGGFLGDNGIHGFSLPTPASLKNGAAHSIHIKFEASATELSGSPASITCGASSSPNYVGFIDHAACDAISGWAADRNRLNTPINVEIYDGTTLIGVVTAGNSRSDVGSFLGDNGAHGFAITTPASLLNGAVHSLHVKFETSTTELSGSPASVNCTSLTASYVGYVDHIACDTIGGWVADRNRLNTPITVSIYGNGVLIATVQANASRPDVGAFLGDNGRHGFSIPTPSGFKGGKTTTVTVRFEASAMNLLSNSPVTLTCP
jgi:hypothetical protein